MRAVIAEHDHDHRRLGDLRLVERAGPEPLPVPLRADDEEPPGLEVEARRGERRQAEDARRAGRRAAAGPGRTAGSPGGGRSPRGRSAGRAVGIGSGSRGRRPRLGTSVAGAWRYDGRWPDHSPSRSRHEPLASCPGRRLMISAFPSGARPERGPPTPLDTDPGRPTALMRTSTCIATALTRRRLARPGPTVPKARRLAQDELGLALRRQDAQRLGGDRARRTRARASGRSRTGRSWARARRRCSSAPRATTRTSVPRRGQDQRPRQLGHVLPHAQGGDASPTATRSRSTAPTATRSRPARSTPSSTSTSSSSRPTPGSPRRSRSMDKNYRGKMVTAHQGHGQRRAALRVHRPRPDLRRRATSPSSSTTRAARSRSARSRSWSCPRRK